MVELFQSVFTTDSNHHLPDTRKRAKRPIPPLRITVDGVKKLLLRINTSKAQSSQFREVHCPAFCRRLPPLSTNQV